MNEQTFSKDELARRYKLVFDYFTNPKRLHQSHPPQMTLLLSLGVDMRSYYVMEEYTDNCIYIDIREMFRIFRHSERIPLTIQVKSELEQVGAELARFCLKSKYDLAIDLSGKNEENMQKVINSLTCLGYETSKVLFTPESNPYVDVDPEDFGGILPPEVWEKIHTDWIYNAALSVDLRE